MDNFKKGGSIKEGILAKIKTGQAKMRPKWYFVLKAALFIIGTLVTFVALLYLISFIFFVLRQTGVWFMPIFGLMGIGVFLTSLPWLLIILAVIFVLLLEVLVKQHSIAYSKPILYSVVIIVVLAGLSGFVISRAGVHEKFFDFARRNKIPLAGRMYENYAFKDYDQIHAVIVKDITDKGLRVNNCRGEILTITTTTETKMFPFEIRFGPQDRLVVWGNKINGGVTALGIRKIIDYSRAGQDCLFLPMIPK